MLFLKYICSCFYIDLRYLITHDHTDLTQHFDALHACCSDDLPTKCLYVDHRIYILLADIVMIDVIIFYKLNFQKNKTADVKCYFITIFEIDDALTIYRVKNDLKILLIEINEVNEIFIKKFSLKEIKAKFYLDFHNLLQTFDSIIIKNLSFHCFYDHKIDFIDDFHTMQN